MKWWMRSQHPVWAIGAALVGAVAVIFLPDSIALPIPSLSGSTAFAAIRPFALISVLMTVSLWASASAGHKSAVLSAVRSMKRYVFASVSAVLGTCAFVVGAWAIISGPPAPAAGLLMRDVLGLSGLGLVLLPLTGYRYAGAISTAYVFVCAIFGRTRGEGDQDSALWAWPISQSASFVYWLPAIFLFVAGGLLWLLRSGDVYSRVMIAHAMDTRRE
jgi:hypothetical protein